MSSPYEEVELIRRKRDGDALSTEQIQWLITAYAADEVPDEQMAAFAMAVYFRGMSRDETRDLALAIAHSGIRLDLADLGRPTVDKHSTGGVGDKITLPLMPLVASFGAAVPQLSGRGLGHTGGTLDKLESIPGWRADVTTEEFLHQLRTVGGGVFAATADLAPADRKLYALRDVTSTVDSLPLMAASIMSKKIAEGTDALVLDVKHGTGALMRELDDARRLAQTMVEIGNDAGVRTTALLTRMDAPLGRTIGNANEVRESLEVLAGGGPADVLELTLALATEMLTLAGFPDADVSEALRDGRAMDTWRRAVIAQGGDPDAPLPVASENQTVTADADGVVEAEDALAFGIAAWRLGAGRSRKEDPVMHAAGIDLHVKPGEPVRAGQPLFTVMTDDASRIPRALELLTGAITLAAPGTPVDVAPLITERVTG